MVRYVSDRMAVMYLGSLVEVGPADEVYFDPWHPYTRILVASNPQPDPRTERARETTVVRGEIASPINVGAGCRFAGRCPEVMDVCRGVTPPPLTVTREGKTRQVACHLYQGEARAKI
jgi:oligopeptide/dipeptide ABC transporter ATP-binding protein